MSVKLDIQEILKNKDISLEDVNDIFRDIEPGYLNIDAPMTAPLNPNPPTTQSKSKGVRKDEKAM